MVPPVTRLHCREYVGIVLGIFLVLLEAIIHIITAALPSYVIHFFYSRSKSLFNRFGKPHQRRSTLVKEITKARGFVAICSLFGYSVEEHIVQTKDGYLLGIHRICTSKEKKAPIVYLHHGLMMNSEIWVVNSDRERNIPFVLADLGFDVWLGNNRGNKYSKKSIFTNATQREFWNFSIDDFALRDIPDTIDYILSSTRKKRLSYIGFSQGTAQSFAALSIHPKLNDKVNCFIALAPALSPKGLQNPFVDALMKANPSLIYLIFGRKAILSSTVFWQNVLYPPIFVRIIDASVNFLFGWKSSKITFQQKVAAYAHLYSFTSVKAVVHWFQIMNNKSFQMYDDAVPAPKFFSPNSYYQVAKFPTRNIRSPIILIYGTVDSLVDIDDMLKELPSHTKVVAIDGYEHVDLLWGQDVDSLVIPKMIKYLSKYSGNSKKINHSSRPVSPWNSSSTEADPVQWKLKPVKNKSSNSSVCSISSQHSGSISFRHESKGFIISSNEPLAEATIQYAHSLPKNSRFGDERS